MRLEEASMNAWPGLKVVLDDGWIVRFAEGHTKRANSITMLKAGEDIPGRLRRCEALFAAQNLTPCARITPFAAAAVKPALDRAGYGLAFDHTVALWRDLSGPLDAGGDVEIREGAPGAGWLAAKDRLDPLSGPQNSARARILDNIAIPVAFAAAPGEDRRYASLAYIAVHDGIASLNMVLTDPDQRGQGLAERVCKALFAWARDRAGAKQVFLQCLAANPPARRLYARMGFSEPLYAYHYRLRNFAHPLD